MIFGSDDVPNLNKFFFFPILSRLIVLGERNQTIPSLVTLTFMVMVKALPKFQFLEVQNLNSSSLWGVFDWPKLFSHL